MTSRTNIDTTAVPWQPASDVFPGYCFEGLEPGYGAFVKVLRKPGDGGGCWQVLLRFAAPSGKALRLTATAASDEEAYILSDTSGHGRVGAYSCNPAGLRHGQTIVGEVVALVHYHGDPDDIIRAEGLDLHDLAG
jgi:hypothetical protein